MSWLAVEFTVGVRGSVGKQIAGGHEILRQICRAVSMNGAQVEFPVTNKQRNDLFGAAFITSVNTAASSTPANRS